jgi:phosphatidylinositol-3-phosphatase
MKRLLLSVAALATTLATATPAPVSAATERPKIDHVVVVVLENTTAEDILGAKKVDAPFLNGLVNKGAQLDAMYGTDHNSLPNYLAMISGHASTAETRADCFVYSCVYGPGEDETVVDQMEAKNLTWKGYIDGMDTPCLHTEEGRVEKYRTGYATRHNPFLYFAGIVRNEARCATHDVPLSQLAADTTAGPLPNLSFIVPDTCHDAHDCSLSVADTWVKDNVGPLLERPEIRDHGLVVFTFDEAEGGDQRGCCENSRGGHIATWLVGTGVAAGVRTNVPYNHYSLLRTIEDTFGLPCLRHACDALTHAYGPEVYGGATPNVVPSKPLPAKRPVWKNALIAVLAIFVAVRVWFMVRIMRQRRARKRSPSA